MFLKKTSYEGNGGTTHVDTTYQCDKVIVQREFKGPIRILLDPLREIMVDREENVGLYLMNDEGHTIEVIQHLEPVALPGP